MAKQAFCIGLQIYNKVKTSHFKYFLLWPHLKLSKTWNHSWLFPALLTVKRSSYIIYSSCWLRGFSTLSKVTSREKHLRFDSWKYPHFIDALLTMWLQRSDVGIASVKAHQFQSGVAVLNIFRIFQRWCVRSHLVCKCSITFLDWRQIIWRLTIIPVYIRPLITTGRSLPHS